MVVLENYKKVLADFLTASGESDVTLFAVLKMDEFLDKWSVITSMSWVNESNRSIVFSRLIDALQRNLSSEELSEVARISFYTPDEHLIELFQKEFKEGQHIREDARVNGNVIHEGYIVALKDADHSLPKG
jgi:hypothetical protein